MHTTCRANATGELHLPSTKRKSGDHATARLHREWLRTLPDKTGKTLTTLAKEIHISPSTLTRPVQEGDDGTSTLHARTIAKITFHTGVAGPALGGAAAARRELDEEAAPYEMASNDPLSAVLAALGAGHGAGAAITPWLLATRALELAGYLAGDIVLVDLGNADPKPGDAVCAQVYDWPSMRAETVMRIYERAGAQFVLVARTADPALNAILPVDNERVVIKGVLLPHRLRPQELRS